MLHITGIKSEKDTFLQDIKGGNDGGKWGWNRGWEGKGVLGGGAGVDEGGRCWAPRPTGWAGMQSVVGV